MHHWDIGAHWPDLRPLADAVVLAGQRGPVGAVVGLVVAGTARRLRSWRPLLHPASAVVALNLVVGGLKLIIGRSGPYTGHDDFFVGGMEFPSGHASNAVLMWGSLAVVLASSGLVRQRWALLAGVVAVTGAVSSACIVLDTHWVSDLVAGWLVGGALLALISAIVRPVAPRPRRQPRIGATDLRTSLAGLRCRRPGPTDRESTVRAAGHQDREGLLAPPASCTHAQ